MTVERFLAFYPSMPYMAVNKGDLENNPDEQTFNRQMAEIVFEHIRPDYTLKFSRDGRVLLRLHQLEIPETADNLSIEAAETLTEHYIDLLNVINLLLDSALIEMENTHYFRISEITINHVFTCEYENQRWVGEGIATQSWSEGRQRDRFWSTHNPHLPIEISAGIFQNRVISIATLESLALNFERIASNTILTKDLALLARSLAAYQAISNEASFTMAWFAVESKLRQLARDNIHLRSGHKINNKTKVGVIINFLKRESLIPPNIADKADDLREVRNKVSHRDPNFFLSTDNTRECVELAHTLIQNYFNFQFRMGLSRNELPF